MALGHSIPLKNSKEPFFEEGMRPANRIDRSPGTHYCFPMKFRIVVEPDEDGVFVAECPSLAGCVSHGATRPEALKNIQDAISGYLASLKKHDEAPPFPIMTKEQFTELL
jgi:antitoxin HicB